MKKLSLLSILATGILLLNCASKKQEKINWEHNVEVAVEQAQENNKPIMVDFMAEWCPPCQKMDKTTFSNHQLIEKSKKFITVRIDVDQQRETAVEYNGNASKYGGVGIPNILFLNSNNEKIRHIIGYQSAQQLTAVMDSVLTGKYDNYPVK